MLTELLTQRNLPALLDRDYQKYIRKEHMMPFDQHFLIASIAPRYVCEDRLKLIEFIKTKRLTESIQR